MKPQFLLDTDTCIHLRRARDPHLVRRFELLDPGQVGISVVSYGELYRGALRSVDPELTLRLLTQIAAIAPILDMPGEAGAIYGQLRVDLERAGMVIGSNDMWIAAHALASGLTLVSGNLRELRRVSGLHVVDWISRG